MSTGVRIRDLDYRIGTKQILRSINLEAQPGEILAIMGLSGGGKTTLLKCVAGLARPTAGEIWIGEDEIVGLTETQLNEIRRRMGMVFQYAALFDSLTVYDNVSFGLRYRHRMPESQIREIVASKLGAVGMEGSEKMMPAELSGGMRKRVGLARALATDPELLLYDEPTSGLDPVVGSVIDALIQRVGDTLGVTSILVSHHLPSIFRIADRVAMLYGGRVEAVGTVEEIRACDNPIVRQFVEGRSEGPIHVVG